MSRNSSRIVSSRIVSSQIVALGLFLATLCPGGTTTAAGSASSQAKDYEKPYALIFGTVWGPDNHPLYAVRVKIRRAADKKARWELFSDHNGEFALRVPEGPGDYLVWADSKGYKFPNNKQLQAGSEIKVHIDNVERADIGLHLK